MAVARKVEALNLLVDKITANKLRNDPSYLQEYVDNLRKAGFVLKHSSELNVDGLRNAALVSVTTTQQLLRSEDTVSSIDQENVQGNSDHSIAPELNTVMTVSEKEQDSEVSKDTVSTDRTVSLNNKDEEEEEDQTTGSQQNSGESSTNNITSEWNIAATRLLISTRLEMENEFQKPVKKRKLWDKISKIMKDQGHDFGAIECHTKWRNLMGTYRKIVERSKICGPGSIRWEYYREFNKVYGNTANVTPPEIIYVRPLRPNCSTYSNIEQLIPSRQEMPLPQQFAKLGQKKSLPCVGQEKPLPSQEASTQTPLFKRKRNCDEFPLWFKTYLEKRKKDNQKKLELKERRWQHIREIENKKIESMKKLTTVLKQFLEK